ncbi:MAPEG family protein [Paraneptunicella aestuarii]|uniref:MAPEG family protein n=1 Tax=Paraneptunicella aestuarii TaxID=2831148 RepID=UPI001E433949|nr:MAPEG family protein [Paraneptunicella aestuarii]
MNMTLIATPITAFYAGLLGALYLYLCLQVIFQRREKRIGLGDGGDKYFLQVMRVQGNFAEYVPLALVMMLIAEINQSHELLLHGVGVTLLLGRLLHAYGIRRNPGVTWQRFYGTLATYIVLLVLIGLNLLVIY